MRALALLGPRALRIHVEEFRSGAADMVVLESPAPDAVLRALESRPDIALVFGGDGTLNRHLAALVENETPVIAVPTGSGNDFARATGTPAIGDAKRVWLAALQGKTEVVSADLGCVEYGGAAPPRYFSCCANIGLDADAARRTDRFPNRVKQNGGYFLGGVLALLQYQPLQMCISSDGAEMDEPSWFVSVSNTPTYGGGLKIAPQASICDGFLDVTVACRRNFSRGQLARHFPKIFAGDHIKLPQLKIMRTTQIAVEGPAPMQIYADGEMFGETPCRILIRPNVLRVVQSI